MYCCADKNEDPKKDKLSCKGIPKDGNNMNYQRFSNVLCNNHNDVVLNKGFRYIAGHMKSYEQVKKGLSYVYHKRKVAANGIDTSPLDI